MTDSTLWQRQMVQDDEMAEHYQPPNIYLRNYESSKERCNRVEAMNKTGLLDPQRFD